MPGPNIHITDAQYAEPLLRAPSPSSSIGTDYGPDETSITDAQMSPEEFDRMCQERLKLSEPRDEESRAKMTPLLPKTKTPQEERVLHIKVMHNLRDQVAKLQDDELFERSMLKGTVITDQQLPSSNDIDAIMRSIMGPPSSSRSTTIDAPTASATPITFAPTPLNLSTNIFSDNFPTDRDSESSGTTAGKRQTRNTVRTRRT